VVADPDPRAGRRSALAAAPRRLRAFDESPLGALDERDAGRAMAEPKRAADLRLAQRAAVDEEVALDGRGRRRDAPRRTDRSPRRGELAADPLGVDDRGLVDNVSGQVASLSEGRSAKTAWFDGLGTSDVPHDERAPLHPDDGDAQPSVGTLGGPNDE
jgi:hypothetical protein